MKSLSLAALFAFLLISVCNAANVTIAESALRYANGTLANGTLTVSWPTFAVGGVTTAGGSTTVPVTNGVLSITLVANDLADPPMFYAARFALGRTSYAQQWVVATVAGPLTISDVVRSSLSPITIVPSQISKVGAVAGDLLYYNGTNWVRLPVGANTRVLTVDTSLPGKIKWGVGGGGGSSVWGGITGTLTDQTDLVTALAAKQNALGFTPANAVHTHAAADTTSGVFDAARIPALNYEPAITAGTSSQVWLGNKTWATLNSALVPEVTNLYFTNGRAVAAMAGLYEVPLTFSSPLVRTANNVACPTCGTGTGTGDVVGPASATDKAVARFNTTTGKLIQTSVVTIDDSGNVAGPPSVSTGDGTTAGSVSVKELSANGNNFRKWLAADLFSADLTMLYGDSLPTAGQVMRFGAPVANISAQTWGDAAGVGTCSAGSVVTGTNNNGAPTCTALTTAYLPTAHKTFVRTINLFDPVVGDSYRVLLEFGQAVTLTRVTCNVTGGTNMVINLMKTTEATSGSGGTQALTADLTCTAGAMVASSTFSSASVAARIPLALKITSLSGTNTDGHVIIEGVID